MPKSPRKQKGAGGERRAEILAAAFGILAQRGYAGLSTRNVAEAVGISQPTLYAYFPSKAALLSEARRLALLSLEVQVALSRAPSECGLFDWAQAILESFASAWPGQFQAAFGAGCADRSDFERLRAALQVSGAGRSAEPGEVEAWVTRAFVALYGSAILMRGAGAACVAGFEDVPPTVPSP